MLNFEGMKALPKRKRTYSSRRSRKDGLSRNGVKKKKDLRRSFRRWQRVFSKYTGPLAVFAVLAILVYVVFFSALFSLESIEVIVSPDGSELEGESLKQEIKKKVSESNLLLLKPQRLSFLKDNPAVEKFEIEKQWPDGLNIKITKRVPQAILEDSIGRLFLVDGNGVVFSRAKDSDLPLIKYSGVRLSIGDEVASREVNFVLYTLDKVGQTGFQIESIRAGTDVYLKVAGGPEVILPLNDRGSVDRMIEIVEGFRFRGENLSKIDLRYKNPVIEYE